MGKTIGIYRFEATVRAQLLFRQSKTEFLEGAQTQARAHCPQ